MAMTPRSEPPAPSSLDHLLAEFSDRWARGESPRAEDYLGRLPDAETSEEDALELVYHEFCLAEQSGLEPDPSSFLERFPALRARLGHLFGLHQVIDPARLRLAGDARLVDLPEPGDEVGPYRLLRELGRGGFARVYLAEQTDLSDRLVVVKISRRAGIEPQLLARARHPYIVELLRHAQTGDGVMHLVCMPFVGGSTLAEVLKLARARRRLPRSGLAFLLDLDEVAAPEYPASSAEGPVRESLRRMTYARLCAWIVARLAEALDHAHRQGVTHGDLKPSNVLIAADGRPMLLDFNLALDWRTEDLDDARSARGGGTLAYMAPERLESLTCRAPSTLPSPLDRHRADLYALGQVLLEMLSGDPPSVPDDAGLGKGALTARMAEARRWADLRVILGRRCVPPALRSVLARCLAADPADRYRSGRELAADLDRWRLDRPLAVADEPAWPVRLARWSRARRQPLIAGALLVLIALGGGGWLSARLNGTLAERARVKLERLWGGAEPGVYHFLSQRHWRPDESLEPRTARRHRSEYGLLEPQGHWLDRPDVASLPASEREDLELWLLERTWSEAAARLARSEDTESLTLALADLERVPEWAALEPILALRAHLRDQLGLPEPPHLPADRQAPAWVDAFLRGLKAEAELASEALDFYQRVLNDRPESYWARYRAASVCFRLGRYDDAIKHLEHCLRRRPNVSALHAQKAACLFLLGDDLGAVAACDRAITLDPDQPHAYQNRAYAHARLGQTAGLEADLRRFAALLDRHQNPAQWELRLQSFVWLNQSLPLDVLTTVEPKIPFDDSETRNSLAALLDEAGRPEQARKQYDLALQADPNHLIARFRRANIRYYKLRDPGAYDDFIAVANDPRIEELAREQPDALRALQMAAEYHDRRGEGQEAVAYARRSLDLARQLGLHQGESHYALARAYATLAREQPDAEQAVFDELTRARQANPKYLNVWYRKDAVFDPIRATSISRLQGPPAERRHD